MKRFLKRRWRWFVRSRRRRAGARRGPRTVVGALIGLRPNHKGGDTVIGWARDRATGRRVVVDIFVGDDLIITARPTRFRPSRYGSSASRFGFRADLPQNFACGEAIKLTAVARTPNGPVRIARLKVRHMPAGRRLDGPSVGLPLINGPIGRNNEARTSAAIILTSDGAPVLRKLLESIAHHEPGRFRRIIVVDHASEDDTHDVVGAFRDTLPLTVSRKPRGRSFAQSNNQAAAICDEDNLFFINNDIVLTEPCIEALSATLTPDVGIAGLRLMDPPSAKAGVQATQHVGIHFCATSTGVVPFETRNFTELPQAGSTPIETPAATAAMFAMRRATFQSLGGFEEGYHFGMEDVDLCLRSLQAGYRNIAVNSVSAIHIGSATRRNSTDARRRNRANARLFDRRWREALRRSLIRDRFERPGFWTGRSIHFGFVLPKEPESAPACREAVEALGQALLREIPAKVFVHEADRPIDFRDLDVIILMEPRFSARRLSSMSCTATLVAWAWGNPRRWSDGLWQEAIDLWFATPDLAKGFARRTGQSVIPLDGATPSNGAASPDAMQFIEALHAYSRDSDARLRPLDAFVQSVES